MPLDDPLIPEADTEEPLTLIPQKIKPRAPGALGQGHKRRSWKLSDDQLGELDSLVDTAQPAPATPAQPEKEGSYIGRGFKESMQQVPQLGHGLKAIAGATIEGIAGEGGMGTALKKSGVEGYQKAGEEIAKNAKPTDSWSYAFDKAQKDGDTDALQKWVLHGIGYVGGQIGQTLLTAGIGAVGGKFVASVAAKQIAEGMVAKEAAKIATSEAGKKLAKDEIRELATKAVTKKFATVGTNAALAGSALGMEGGEIGGDLAAKSVKEGRTLSGEELGKAFASTLAAGGLEFVGDRLGLDILLGKSPLLKPAASAPGVSGRVQRGAIAGTAAAPIEGATEFGQTMIEEYGKGNDPFSAETLHHAKDAGALGVLGGGLAGGVGGFMSPAQQAEQAPPNKPAPLGLPHLPNEPRIIFPDGTIGTRQQAEDYINRLPPDQQPAARAKLMGLGQQDATINGKPARSQPTSVLNYVLKRGGLRAKAAAEAELKRRAAEGVDPAVADAPETTAEAVSTIINTGREKAAEIDAGTTATKVPDTPTPEPVGTLNAQMVAFAEGRKPGVLLTPGEPAPTSLPPGAKAAEIPGHGTLIYRDDATLQAALNGQLGTALGYGIDEKPNSTLAVTARDGDGTVIQDVLTDGSEGVTKAAQTVAGPDGTVEIRTAEEALGEREQAKAPRFKVNAKISQDHDPITESLRARVDDALNNHPDSYTLSHDGFISLPKKEGNNSSGTFKVEADGSIRMFMDNGFGFGNTMTNASIKNTLTEWLKDIDAKNAKPEAPQKTDDGIERYQWMRNKEGGQEHGNRTEIRPLTRESFNEFVKPLATADNKDYDTYRKRFPDITHMEVVSQDKGETWRIFQLGSAKELRPKPENPAWVKKVDSFDSPEAVAHGNTADSDPTPQKPEKIESAAHWDDELTRLDYRKPRLGPDATPEEIAANEPALRKWEAEVTSAKAKRQEARQREREAQDRAALVAKDPNTQFKVNTSVAWGGGYQISEDLRARVEHALNNSRDSYKVFQDRIRLLPAKDDFGGQGEFLVKEDGTVWMLGDDNHHWGSTMSQASVNKTLKDWLKHVDAKKKESPKTAQTAQTEKTPEESGDKKGDISGNLGETGETVGVDDKELNKIVQEFNTAQAAVMEDEQPVTNVFQAPKKGEIVRLGDKVKVYHKDHGWMTPAEARDRIAEWKDHAEAQGSDNAIRSENSKRVVLSLFDLTGEWSKPWEEAGYQVYRFDIQADPDVGDVNNFSTEFFGDWFGDFEGQDIYAILAACPCTDFAGSGARHFAAKDDDGRTVSSVKLVHKTLATIEYFKPAVWALENPVGRIEKLGGLPPWRLSFDPNHLGDPYTKKTLIWGRFNGDLPIAPVEPTEGSKMHMKYGGKSIATKNARSVTPEGFSYGFFMANNAHDHPAMAIANKYDRLDRGVIEQAVKAGVTAKQIDDAVEDFYYMDLDDDAANQAIRDLIASPPKAERDQYAAYRKAIKDAKGDIPKGMQQQINMDHRLKDGQAEELLAYADTLKKSAPDLIQQLRDLGTDQDDVKQAQEELAAGDDSLARDLIRIKVYANYSSAIENGKGLISDDVRQQIQSDMRLIASDKPLLLKLADNLKELNAGTPPKFEKADAEWWDGLTPNGRRLVIEATGIYLDAKTTWANVADHAKAKLLANKSAAEEKPASAEEPNLKAAMTLIAEQKEVVGNKTREGYLKTKVRALAKKTPQSDVRTVVTLDVLATRLDMDNLEFMEEAKPAKAEPANDGKADRPTAYFRGDLAEYTGKTETLNGKLFYEVKVLEGPEKGKLKVITTPPGGDKTPPKQQEKKPVTPQIEPPKAPEKRSKFHGGDDSTNDAINELRNLSHDKEQPGDVALGNGKYVSFEDAVRLTREGIASGEVKAVPFQVVNRLDLTFRDVDRVIDAATTAEKPATKRKAQVVDNGPTTPGEFIVREGTQNHGQFSIGARGQPVGIKYFFDNSETRGLVDDAIAEFIRERGATKPPAPAPKKASKGKTDLRTELQAHFAPGNIIRSAYRREHDRVVAFDWNNGAWSVTVEKVKKDEDGKWVVTERARTHATQPDKRDEIVERGAPQAAPAPAEADPTAGRFANNKIFTADKVAAARARIKAKLGNINSGIDPELMMDGMTIAGAYIEEGVRDFSTYTKLMVGDFGDKIKPYLLSFYEAARAYPGIDKAGMTPADDAAAQHQALLTPEVKETVKDVIGEGVVTPKKARAKPNGQMVLTQDWGVESIDGWIESPTGKNQGSDFGLKGGLKDDFLDEAAKYLKQVGGLLEAEGFEPYKDRKGRTEKPVDKNEAGPAVSGEVSLLMRRGGVGIYVQVGTSAIRGLSGNHPQGVSIMYRVHSQADIDRYGGYNVWLNASASATELFNELLSRAERLSTTIDKSAAKGEQDENRNEPRAPLGATGDRPLEGTPAEQVPGTQGGGTTGSRGNKGGGKDTGRTGDADGTGVPTGGSLGSGTGDTPVPAGGTGSIRGSAGEPAVPGGATGANDAQPDTPGRVEAGDYRITESTRLGEGGAKTKYHGNVAAIRLMRELLDSGRKATPEEQNTLARYVGWGGIPQAFDADNQSWTKEHAELKALLTPEEWQTAVESTQYAHYTSENVIRSMYDAAAHLGFGGGTILEPGSGVGNFIGLMPDSIRSGTRFTGVERESIAGGIAKLLYPNQNIQQADFTAFNATDGYFDFVIGNPPFSDTKLTDISGRKHLSGLSIHNYFFAKAVDLLRDGGILMQVVTSSFMDAKRDKARNYIGERTKLLGAIRLPNSAFMGNAGTDVTTDIIFLQKLPESEWGSKAAKDDAKRWQGLGVVMDPLGGDDIPINQYFVDHPEMMIGTMQRVGGRYHADMPGLVAHKGDMGEMLAKAISRLPANVYVDVAKANTAAMEGALTETMSGLDVEVNGYFVRNDKLYQRVNDIAGEQRAVLLTPNTMWTEKTQLGEKKHERLKKVSELRNTLRQLINAERNGDEAMNDLRAKLNEQYDEFIKGGLIHDRGSIQLFGDDPDFPLLASLERNYDAGISEGAAKKQGIKQVKSSAKKADIFTKAVVSVREAVDKADSPVDALMISIAEKGRIDAPFIGGLLGRDGAEVLEELTKGDEPELFKDPESGGYVLRDEYLSGNVRKKFLLAQAAGMYQNADALKRVIPEDIPSHEIVGRLGAPWVPSEVYADFIRHVLGEQTEARVTYVKALSSFAVQVVNPSDVANTNTYGVPSSSEDHHAGKSAVEIITALLNNRAISIRTRPDREGRTELVKEATDEANDKAALLRESFTDWLMLDADRAEKVGRIYNDTVNNYVERKFLGKILTFPGKVPDTIIKFRRHQTNAIARILQEGRALLDHVVGSGKTFTVIGAAQELKRTGLARKSMIVVPNHLVKQWAADYYRLYPGANVLAATKKDFERQNRRQFLARIATGNWDAVIIAHSSFGFIKPDSAFEEQFNYERIAEIMDAISELRGEEDQGSKRTVKQLAKMKEKLEQRIKSLRDRNMDALLDLGQLGVDQIFVDEAHLFKNLMYTTKMQNVRGLNNPTGSQRAYDMMVKTRQIMHANGHHRGVVFATGTPISNSMAEMYHMLRYLYPDGLSDMGMETFDAWANSFAEVEQVWMQSLSGAGFKATNRMSRFVNAADLLKMYNQVTDTVTQRDVQEAYREENEGREFPLPRLKGGKRTPVSLKKTDELAEYMLEIAQRAKIVEERKRPPEKGEDNVLSIMTDARKAAMDIRLVDFDIQERHPEGRIAMAGKEVMERYHKYNDVRGTQLIFSDMGTPLKHAKKEMAEYEELRATIAAGADPDTIARAELGDETAMGKIEDADKAQETLDGKGQDWLDAIKAGLRGFSIYDDMKAYLMENGVPEKEIAFIHDYNTDDQKAALFAAVNSGKIRILLGSTAKMGAGTNVQERLVAIHHIDVPWKPSDIEQREGRIIRQGNVLATPPTEDKPNPEYMPDFEVEILAYATQDSLDLFMWQVQEKKLGMINQLREGKVGREFDNAFEEMQMSAGEMQAAATSNPYLMEEIQLKDKIKKLERQQKSHVAQGNDLITREKRARKAVADLPETIKGLEKIDREARAYHAAMEAREVPATIDGKQYTKRREATEYIRAILDEHAQRYDAQEADNSIRKLQQTVDNALNKTDIKPKLDETLSKSKLEKPINIDGKDYVSIATISDRIRMIYGDADPIAFERGDQTYYNRSTIRDEIRDDYARAVEEETTVPMGSFGNFEVSVLVKKARDKNMEVEIYAPARLSDGTDLGSYYVGEYQKKEQALQDIDKWIRAASTHAHGVEWSLRNSQRELADAQKTLADLGKMPERQEWAGKEELAKARERYREVLRLIVALANPAPEIKPDGTYLVMRKAEAAQAVGGQPSDEAKADPRFYIYTQGMIVVKDSEDGFPTKWDADVWLAEKQGKPKPTPAPFAGIGGRERMPADEPGNVIGRLRWENAGMAEDDLPAFSRKEPKKATPPGGFSASVLPKSHTRAIVDSIRGKWKNAPEVIVVGDMADPAIPEAVRRENERQLSQGAKGEPEGFIAGGKVYVVASQMRTPGDVVRVLLHESLGHFGLRGLYGAGLEKILRQVVALRNKDVRAKAKQYGLDMNNDKDKLKAAEEVLAELAQTNPQSGFVQRAIAAIRTWLRENIEYFKDMKLSDGEIINQYLIPARQFVQRGAPRDGASGVTAFTRDSRNERDRELRELAHNIRHTTGSDLAREAVGEFLEERITNLETGFEATVTRKSLGKMMSSSAWKNSVSPQAHYMAVGNLDALFRVATPSDKRAGNRPEDEGVLKAMRFFDAPMPFNGEVLRAVITVQEFENPDQLGHRLYTVHAVDIERTPADTAVSRASSGHDNRTPTSDAGVEARFAQMVEIVKAELNQTDTADFRKWFGNSKVVDRAGNPLVVYHGTTETFSEFNVSGEGAFFTTNREAAEDYGDITVATYLSIKNPYEVTEKQWMNGRGLSIEAAREAGYDGYVIRDHAISGDVDTVFDDRGDTWIAFKPTQIKSATGNSGAFDATNPDINFSRSAASPKLDAAKSWLDQVTDSLIYNFVDRFKPLRDIQKRAGAVSERQDASLAEERYSGIVRARTDDFHADLRDPLLKAIHDGKLDYDQVEEYLHALHAPSRNAHMREINPTAEELQARLDALSRERDDLATGRDVKRYIKLRREQRQALADIDEAMADESLGRMIAQEMAALRKLPAVKRYSEVTDKLRALRDVKPFEGDNTALSGMSNAEAKAVIEKARKAGKIKALEKVSSIVDTITAQTRQVYVEAGLETAETIEGWESLYEHYVPLHRDEVGGTGNPPIGQGYSIRGRESKRATGSTKEVTDILAHIVAAHEAAIVRAEKTKVDLALYRFAMAHPDPDVWTLDAAPKIRMVDPVSGVVAQRIDPLYKNRPNVLTLKIGGEEHTISFTESNPEAMRLAASLKNLGMQELGQVTQVIGKATRFLAMMSTSANPVFVARNFLRDIQTSFVNLSDTELAGMKKQVFADLPSAIKGMWNMSRGDRKSKWAKYAHEFRAAGGQTGWMEHYGSIGERADGLRKQLAAMDPTKINLAKQTVRAWWELIEDANGAVENGVRLAAYVNARKAGLSEGKAAALAKNLTVNFNRHGSKGVELNMWYMFLNASIQGTARLMKAMSNKQVQRIVGYVVASGFLMDLLARSLAADDDDDGENDYDQVGEHIKAMNFVFWVDGRPLSLPMPYGYNFFANVGRKISESLFRENYSAVRSATDLGAVFVDAFSPTGQAGSALQYVAPTIADPFIMWAENKNFAGIPLRREQHPFGVPKPEYLMGQRSNSAPAKWLAEVLNVETGGNEVRPGVLNLNPALFDFAVSSALGGAGRTYLQAFGLPFKLAQGDDIQAREVPFANIVLSAKPEYQTEKKFWEAYRKVELAKKEIKHFRESGNLGKVAELREERGELKLVDLAHRTDQILNHIRKKELVLEQRDPENKRELKEKLEQQRRETMAHFNKRYTAVTAEQ